MHRGRCGPLGQTREFGNRPTDVQTHKYVRKKLDPYQKPYTKVDIKQKQKAFRISL